VDDVAAASQCKAASHGRAEASHAALSTSDCWRPSSTELSAARQGSKRCWALPLEKRSGQSAAWRYCRRQRIKRLALRNAKDLAAHL